MAVAVGSDAPIAGTAGQWPTADAINNRISISERANGGRVSPLRGTGDAFIKFGNEFGINPGVICAILQRESQLGCDGSILPTRCNNFSGITLGDGNAKCAAASGIAGRDWSQFRTAEDGLRGTFKLLNSQLYRSTGGTLEKVMEKYSPAFENDWTAMWATFAAVGSNLGITITPQTNIYTNGGGPITGLPNTGVGDIAGAAIGPIVNWITDSLAVGMLRFILVAVGFIGLYLGVKALL